MATPAKFIDEALALPREVRAELVTALLRSLDDGLDEDPDEVEAAWAAEIAGRIADREAGRASAQLLGEAIEIVAIAHARRGPRRWPDPGR